jgi:hypothetical protein
MQIPGELFGVRNLGLADHNNETGARSSCRGARSLPRWFRRGAEVLGVIGAG